MKVLKKMITVLALFGAETCLFALNSTVKDLVNKDYYDQLMKDGFVRVIHSSADSEFVLLPENDYKQNCLDYSVKKKDGNFPFVTESLFYIPKSECIKQSDSKDQDLGIDDVSVIFRSISKMEGMRYYSYNTRMHGILYKSAYMVKDAKNRQKIADPVEGSANEKVYYCFQNDTSFGKCVYELHYYENDGTFYANFSNIDSMGFGLIKAIDPGNMRINAVVLDCGDSFLLYLATDTDCMNFPGIEKKLTNSLTSRMDALYKWFLRMF